jgi:hypothetical protein
MSLGFIHTTKQTSVLDVDIDVDELCAGVGGIKIG